MNKGQLTNLPISKRDSSGADNYFFFIIFVIGVSGIIGLKYLGLSQIVITAWPVTLMFIYFTFIVATKRYLLRADIAGDNLYYLGFLFTLVSLAYTLYLYSSSKDPTETIITNFGIALATTIIGLALRVFFYQMRQEPIEFEKEARLELTEAVNKFKKALYETRNDFNMFRHSLQQSIKDGMNDIALHANEQLKKSIEEFIKFVSGINIKIEETFSVFSKNADNFVIMSELTVKQLENIVERFSQLDVPADLIKNSFQPIISAVGETADNIRQYSNLEKDIFERLTIFANRTIRSTETLDEQIESIKTFGMEMEESIGRFDTLFQKLNKFHETWETTIGTLTKDIENQEVIITKIAESKRRVDINLEELAGSIQTNSDQFTQYIEKLISEFAEISERRLSIIKSHSLALEEGVKRSQEAVEKVHGTLTTMINHLVEELSK